jgi:uncharacterized iron-regulated protein
MRLVAVTAAGILLWSTGCATAQGQKAPGWQSSLHQDHPLVGRVWDARRGAFLSMSELEAEARGADFVLLGELHDNPDHHLLQARLIRALAQRGRRPALAFEMLDTSQQPAVDRAVSAAPRDPEALADAVAWDRSGWPPFSLYRPIFLAGMDAGLPIVAANLPRDLIRKAMREGLQAVDPALRARLEQEPPLSAEQLAELTAEMQAAHCGHLPPGMMPAFVLAQRLRDAQLSLRLARAAGEEGAVLIAGAGHVRVDRGVPAYLSKDAPGRSILSVAFREVQPGLLDPRSYEALPFDVVVFTPSAARADPCEGLRTPAPGPTSTRALPEVDSPRTAHYTQRP